MWKTTVVGLLLLLGMQCSWANDISSQVFGKNREGIVAAFGDFNSDELTDVFLITNESYTMQILYAADTEPLLRAGPSCYYNNYTINSIVPGDFDGDALMDVLVTLHAPGEVNPDLYSIYINWGKGADGISCANMAEQPALQSIGEPLAIDFNRDMIIDLFGLGTDRNRSYWIFNESRTAPVRVPQLTPAAYHAELSIPNANAYLDLNMDFIADLVVQTKNYSYEIWHGRNDEKQNFKFNYSIDLKIMGSPPYNLGQAIFADFELQGTQNIIVPLCTQAGCISSSILVHDGTSFQDIHVNFKDPKGMLWGFVEPVPTDVYLKTITARTGDYNMDGYPDLLVTLQTTSGGKRIQTFLLENVPCTVCNSLKRTFKVNWDALNPMGNGTVAATFYDFYQDGVLDVILMEKSRNGKYRPLAFRNTLDYDANFVKVIVLTGLVNKKNPTTHTALGRKRRTYGTNLPGPRITYSTTTQDGDMQSGASVQLPQSSYFALQLPYTIFGLGRTPNFVDSLTVGLCSKYRTWTQLIPNSQIIVVPNPLNDPQGWKAQLFVTPSKLIVMSVIALGGTCLVIIFIILVLYIKEKREDKQEKLQEAHRFHYDAM